MTHTSPSVYCWRTELLTRFASHSQSPMAARLAIELETPAVEPRRSGRNELLAMRRAQPVARPGLGGARRLRRSAVHEFVPALTKEPDAGVDHVCVVEHAPVRLDLLESRIDAE
jgi:hypothetical protein